MQKGQFRKDLYYRLKGAWLYLPPLKERIEDIPVLTEKFLEEFGLFSSQPVSDNAMETLMAYDYPGNIRELRSILRSAVNLARGRVIRTGHLPTAVTQKIRVSKPALPEDDETYVSLKEIEKAHILKVYERTDRNKSQSARLLGIGLNTLRRKLASYGVK